MPVQVGIAWYVRRGTICLTLTIIAMSMYFFLLIIPSSLNVLSS